MVHEVNIKYRNWLFDMPPQRTKMQIPGWAGEKHWEEGQPWHCKPFADAATYGLELIYPFKTEVLVTNEDGEIKFHSDSTSEWDDRGIPFPFKNFAPGHFGFTSSVDIKTEPGYGVLISPHPRFFTDTTDTVPVPSIGLLESDWWPKIFFIAYRAPYEGRKYVFRQGEGVAQLMIVPKEIHYNIEKMSKEEEKERASQEQSISKLGKQIATKKWTDKNGFMFDNKYKVLSQMDHRTQSTTEYLQAAVEHLKNKDKTNKEERSERLTRVYIKPEKPNVNRTQGKHSKKCPFGG
jgi:hypothetical protein